MALTDYLGQWLKLSTNMAWCQSVDSSRWLQKLLMRKEPQGKLAHFIELWRTDRVCFPQHRWVTSDEPCPCGCTSDDDENLTCGLTHFVFECSHTSDSRLKWIQILQELPNFYCKLALLARLRGADTQQALAGEGIEDQHLCCMMAGVLELLKDDGTPLPEAEVTDDVKATVISKVLEMMKIARVQWVSFRKLMDEKRKEREAVADASPTSTQT
jgi:hypothetical protein